MKDSARIVLFAARFSPTERDLLHRAAGIRGEPASARMRKLALADARRAIERAQKKKTPAT